MNRNLFCLLLAASAIFTSCQKSLDSTNPQVVAVDASDAVTGPLNVYVAGTVYDDSGNPTATYWRNSQPITLNSGTPGGSYANAMFMYGNDRYVAGGTGNGATYWKNGVPVYVAVTNSHAPIIIGSGIAVTGKDIYAIGYYNTGQLDASGLIWKNGAESFVSDTYPVYSDARAITISKGDVYVAGSESDSDEELISGRVWKNGKEIYRISTQSDVFLSSIAVSGTDVYFSGFEFVSGVLTYAKYWKNGNEVKLTNGSHPSLVNSLFISGSDVYAAGYSNYGTHNVACYWKNGKQVTITNGTTEAAANSIVVDSAQNVWVAGSIANLDGVTVAVYWKNGARVNLSKYRQNAIATSIFLSRS